MNIGAIIQARTGSTRLPKKILMKINGISVIESVLCQLSYSKSLSKKIVATTIDQSDDILVSLLETLKINYFRGNQYDVLDRYYRCAKYYGLDNIVRISGDAPLIDPQIVDKVVNHYKNSNFDYVNNFSNRNRYPVGTEVEVFSFATLENTWKNAKKPSEREHVTPYIYNNPDKFAIGNVEYVNDLSNLHWTVDRIEDLDLVKAIYKKINKKPILLENILEQLLADPSLLTINLNVDPHEGYKKSIKNDSEN